MKINKMIVKVMVVTVAATMLIGGATVMADETRPGRFIPAYEEHVYDDWMNGLDSIPSFDFSSVRTFRPHSPEMPGFNIVIDNPKADTDDDKPSAAFTMSIGEGTNPSVAPAALKAGSCDPAANSCDPANDSCDPAIGASHASLVATASLPGADGFVDRLYVNALGRPADAAGYDYWVNILNTKQMTGTEVANGFFNSAEFAARDLNNVEFVSTLYRVFFNREPDHNGLNHWVSAINNDGLTRAQVIAGFTNSAEWANTCTAYGFDA